MSCFKLNGAILFAVVAVTQGCSNTTTQEETNTVSNNTTEEISVFKAGNQTVSHFDDHGRAFVVPAGYRLSLDNYFNNSSYPDTQVKIEQKPNQKIASISSTKTPNIWDRYCNQGKLSLKDEDAIERYIQENGIPKQYRNNCRPGNK